MKVLNDFTTSVYKALDEIDPNFFQLDGLIICGTHSPHDVETLINEIKKARENGTPFLGICFGHQLAAIEYARNVLGIKDATSEEFSKEGTFVVYKLPQLKVGLHDTFGLYSLYMGRPIGAQTYWNNYEVLPNFESMWKKADNFITCQFHPEYQSSKDNPHPLLVKFLELCSK